MKGVQKDTFSEKQYLACDHMSISLKLNHLRFWYIAPEATYLVLYIESVDKIFVLNIQRYITDYFGDDILTLDQKSLTVDISKQSELDAQAFFLIKQRCSPRTRPPVSRPEVSPTTALSMIGATTSASVLPGRCRVSGGLSFTHLWFYPWGSRGLPHAFSGDPRDHASRKS